MTREQMIKRLGSNKSLESNIKIVQEYLDTSILSDDERQYFEQLINVSKDQLLKVAQEKE